GVQQSVFSRGASDAHRWQGVTVKLTGPIAGFSRDGPDDARIASNQDRREPGHIEVPVMSSRSVLGVGAPKVSFEYADRVIVGPGMGKWQRRPARPPPKQRHARRPNIPSKGADAEELPRQAFQAAKARHVVAQQGKKSTEHQKPLLPLAASIAA